MQFHRAGQVVLKDLGAEVQVLPWLLWLPGKVWAAVQGTQVTQKAQRIQPLNPVNLQLGATVVTNCLCFGRQWPSPGHGHPPLLALGLEFEHLLGNCHGDQWASSLGPAGLGPMAVQMAAWLKRPVVTRVTPQTPCTQIQVTALMEVLGMGCPFCPPWEPPGHGFVRSLQGCPSVPGRAADSEVGARDQGRPQSGSTLQLSGKSLSCRESRGMQRLGETTAHPV